MRRLLIKETEKRYAEDTSINKGRKERVVVGMKTKGRDCTEKRR